MDYNKDQPNFDYQYFMFCINTVNNYCTRGVVEYIGNLVKLETPAGTAVLFSELLTIIKKKEARPYEDRPTVMMKLNWSETVSVLTTSTNSIKCNNINTDVHKKFRNEQRFGFGLTEANFPLRGSVADELDDSLKSLIIKNEDAGASAATVQILPQRNPNVAPQPAPLAAPPEQKTAPPKATLKSDPPPNIVWNPLVVSEPTLTNNPIPSTLQPPNVLHQAQSHTKTDVTSSPDNTQTAGASALPPPIEPPHAPHSPTEAHTSPSLAFRQWLAGKTTNPTYLQIGSR